jgi:MerR family transcriptional regulator, repressor of the yfmOP operon
MEKSVYIATEDQFRKFLSETVDSILQRRIPEIMRKANRKEYITTKEFRELTGCSYRVQQYLRNTGKIAFSQQGRKIFYKTLDVEKFMEERRVPAKTEEVSS